MGIAALTISGVQVIDHVQYSFDRIPEPGVAALGVAGGCGFLLPSTEKGGLNDTIDGVGKAKP